MARLQKTLTDYVVIAISPALIIAMIASLVFFLVEVLYAGQFQMRLTWVFGCFVFAAVLIGRISIDEGREYAALFAIPLGIATLLAIFRLVEFSGRLAGLGTPFSIGMLALIWWCADKLTWDCTVIDEHQDASGEGLLQTAGLDSGTEDSSPTAATVEATTSRVEQPKTNWWKQFVDRRKRPHAPGVWVVYFSILALPLFGVLQRFIPADDLLSRRYAFKLFCVFVASSLGLLLTTSFLGLRRYLRQRRLEMPNEMAGVWLTVGALIIVGLLGAAMLLPRPYAEYSITHLASGLDSPDHHNASDYAIGNEGIDDEQKSGRAPSETEDGQPSGSGNGEQQQTGANSDEQGDGGDGNQNGESSQKSNEENGQGNGSQSANESQQEEGQPGESEQPDSESPDEQQGESSQSKGSKRSGTSAKNDEPRNEDNGDGNRQDNNEDQQAAQTPPPPANSTNLLSSMFSLLTVLFKWLYYLIFFAVLAYFVWRYHQTIRTALANFIKAITDFWARLFGGREEIEETNQVIDEPKIELPPFSSFTNPFSSGAKRFNDEQLVKYTFAALEAWAREHQCERGSEQTPHEFASQVAGQQGDMVDPLRNLAELYCHAAFAKRRDLPATNIAKLEELWCKLQQEATATASDTI